MPDSETHTHSPDSQSPLRHTPIKLAVLISGSGTTLQNFIDQIAANKLDADIVLTIGSRGGLKGLDRAIAAGLKNIVIDRRQFDSAATFSRQIFAACENAGADLVCLAGWLCLLEIPDRFLGKVMNIHPALLPSFGGKGMYGRRVHQAVIDHGCKITGCTVHFVDNHYDNGPIIAQRVCAVEVDDSAESLAHRVFEEEKIAYPEAIRLYQLGKLKIEGRRVRVTR
jgi:phosphoribosylglycinamide formyltransferase-1